MKQSRGDRSRDHLRSPSEPFRRTKVAIADFTSVFFLTRKERTFRSSSDTMRARFGEQRETRDDESLEKIGASITLFYARKHSAFRCQDSTGNSVFFFLMFVLSTNNVFCVLRRINESILICCLPLGAS